MRRFLQRALPGGSIKGLKAYIAGLIPPPPDRRQRKPPMTAASPEEKVAHCHQRKPPPHLPVDPAATAAPSEEVTVIDSGETVLSSLSPGSAATKRKVKRKRWDRNFYINKKNKRMVGLPSPAVMTTTMMTTTTTSTTTSMTTAAAPDMDPWAVSSTGKVRTPTARKMAKHRRVKPAVDNILNAGNVQSQAALLRALADHPALAPAIKMAGIATSRQMAAAEFVCGQSARMMDRARSGEKLRGNTHKQKRDAVQVMLTFTAPSPVRKAGDPSRRDRARALGVPPSTLSRVDKQMIEKRKLLSAGEMGIHWALAKKKKGYTTISDELKLLLVNEFNNHPQVIVSPNSKDRLQTKNAEGEKIFIQKVMTMVGIGTIFSDIVRENPTIKTTVGERAFRYIISGLSCVRRFTNSYKTMCGCTECIGLQSLHRSLQAKRGNMHHKFSLDAQQRTTRARAEEMARGWGTVLLDPTLRVAIIAGSCARWSVHIVLH